MPGRSMCFSSAAVNGLLVPEPSSATLPGWVAKATSVPSPGSDAGETAAHRARARAHGARQVLGQRIVPAGIEEHQVGLGAALHLLQHQIDRHGLEVEIALGVETGIDRGDVVLPRHLQAMAGIEEQRHVGAAQGLLERADGLLGGGPVEVASLDDLEAETSQRHRHAAGIVGRIGELHRVLIGRVADHQRDALFGKRDRAGTQPKNENSGQRSQTAAWLSLHRRCLSECVV